MSPMRGLLRMWGILILAAIWAAPAAAQQAMKIGYVNSEQLLQTYPGTRAAQDAFNRDVESWSTEAATRKKELDDLNKELSAQTPMLSDEKRRDKEQDLQRKMTEYDQFVQSIWGPNGLVVKRNEEILRPIITKVQTILAKIGADEGYDLILDAADGNILFADTKLDLTARVLDELSKQP